MLLGIILLLGLHVVIINTVFLFQDGEFYRRCYGEHVGFNTFMDAILKYILSQVKLPDLQFMANLGKFCFYKIVRV